MEDMALLRSRTVQNEEGWQSVGGGSASARLLNQNKSAASLSKGYEPKAGFHADRIAGGVALRSAGKFRL